MKQSEAPDANVLLIIAAHPTGTTVATCWLTWNISEWNMLTNNLPCRIGMCYSTNSGDENLRITYQVVDEFQN